MTSHIEITASREVENLDDALREVSHLVNKGWTISRTDTGGQKTVVGSAPSIASDRQAKPPKVASLRPTRRSRNPLDEFMASADFLGDHKGFQATAALAHWQSDRKRVTRVRPTRLNRKVQLEIIEWLGSQPDFAYDLECVRRDVVRQHAYFTEYAPTGEVSPFLSATKAAGFLVAFTTTAGDHQYPRGLVEQYVEELYDPELEGHECIPAVRFALRKLLSQLANPTRQQRIEPDIFRELATGFHRRFPEAQNNVSEAGL